MPREIRLMVSCNTCSRWEVAIRPTEGECERAIERMGWTVTEPQKCPTCKRKPVAAKGETE